MSLIKKEILSNSTYYTYDINDTKIMSLTKIGLLDTILAFIAIGGK